MTRMFLIIAAVCVVASTALGYGKVAYRDWVTAQINNASRDSDQYALFVIDLNPDGKDTWRHIELKASSDNFASGTLDFFCGTVANGQRYYVSAASTQRAHDNCRIYVTSMPGDVRTWKRIQSTLDPALADRAISTLIILVDPSLLYRSANPARIRKGNDNLVWSYVRIGDTDAEMNPSDPGKQYWRAVMPIRWYKTLPFWANQTL